MSNSLRSRVNKLAYQGHITKKDAEKIREALKKQQPKKIKDVLTSDNEFIGYKCVCGTFIGLSSHYAVTTNYCRNCGQHIDWGMNGC